MLQCSRINRLQTFLKRLALPALVRRTKTLISLPIATGTLSNSVYVWKTDSTRRMVQDYSPPLASSSMRAVTTILELRILLNLGFGIQKWLLIKSSQSRLISLCISWQKAFRMPKGK